jgi:hypothetical protein
MRFHSWYVLCSSLEARREKLGNKKFSYESKTKEKKLDNYEGAFETEMTQDAESSFTKSVARCTASIPSSVFVGVAVGAMVLSLACGLSGRGRWGNFIAQLASACVIIGVYNKLIKLEPEHNRGYAS